MKSRTFFLVLIFILLYGCTSNPNAWQPATVTPNVMPRKNVVIVRLGDQLDENVLWGMVIHNIVDQLQ